MSLKRIYVYPTQEKQRDFTWNTDWISPYESMWSIFEKFKYANCATEKDIFHYIGTNDVKSRKYSTWGRVHRDLLTLSSFKDDAITTIFGMPLKQINDQNVQKIFKIIPQRLHNRETYCRDQLYFCPICIKRGFHSLFHQFKLLHVCPYHLIPLLNSCPKCSQIQPFELTNKHSKGPFQCDCGYSFMDLESSDSFIRLWEITSLSELKSDQLKIWINLNDEQVSRLGNSYFHHQIDLEQYPEAIDHILSVLVKDYLQPKTHFHHNVAVSARNIFKFTEDNKNKNDYIRKTKLYNEIYKSSLDSMHSVISHFRNTIFKNHKKCIQDFIKIGKNEDSICPYGYAYVHWIQFLMGYDNRFQVYRASPYRRYYESIEFASKQDDKFLTEIFADIFNVSIDGLTNYNKIAIKWILNRLMILLILNHLDNWLLISQEAANNGLAFRSVPFGLKNPPFFIIIVPSNTKDPIEFHWWAQINKRENHKLVCQNQKKN